LPLPEGIELIEILQQVQQSLRQACQDHAAALRYATLASRDLQGEADARTLVLRSAGEAAGRLRFFSDSRAPKVAQLRAHPRCTLVFLSPTEGLQYRFTGQAQIHQDTAELTQLWHQLPVSGRFNYLTRLSPGERLEQSDDSRAPASDPPAADRSDPPSHFAAIDVVIDSLDWLQLGRTHHHRARFDWRAEAGCEASWITA
jgi:pyridoxine/pyridoxamine 5'-phosphate oxidase|tara:strand:- start:1254 stop:1856 length:603 start_codon:yes stop_codon:yes gene_type:complete